MSILWATIAALAGLSVWAIASPPFGRRLVAVCRALQEPAAVVLAVFFFIAGMWLLADVAAMAGVR